MPTIVHGYYCVLTLKTIQKSARTETSATEPLSGSVTNPSEEGIALTHEQVVFLLCTQ